MDIKQIIPDFFKNQDYLTSDLENEEIRKTKVKSLTDVNEELSERKFLGKIKHGIKKGAKFTWNHKKLVVSALGCTTGLGAISIFGIPLSSIITLTQTTTQMEQLLSNLPVIITLIITVVSLLYAAWTKFKKDGFVSLFKELTDDIDDVYEEIKQARKKNSDGGSSITKKELLDIIGKVDVHSDNLKKKKDKLNEQSK